MLELNILVKVSKLISRFQISMIFLHKQISMIKVILNPQIQIVPITINHTQTITNVVSDMQVFGKFNFIDFFD